MTEGQSDSSCIRPFRFLPAQDTARRLWPYAVTLAMLLLATGGRWILDAWLEDRIPFATYYLAILVSELYGGRGPAVLALASGFLLGDWFFVSPRQDLRIEGLDQVTSALTYLVLGAAVAWLADAQRRARLYAVSQAAALRLSEEQAQARAEELRAIMHAAPAGLCVAYDADCREITGNPRANEVLGVPMGGNLSLTAQPTPSVLPYRIYQEGRELSGSQLPMQHAAASGVPVRGVELDVVLQDGTRRTILMNAAPLRGSQGQVRGAVGAFVDITKRKEMEQALREHQMQLVQTAKLASLGEMATGIAHELNNPLNNIGLVVGNLGDQARTSGVPQQHLLARLQDVQQQVKRAATIIAHLRTFARDASGEPSMPISIHNVILGGLSLVHDSLRLASVQVQMDLETQDPIVCGNQIQLEQVLVNLLTNARDAVAAEAQKTIRISTVIEHGVVMMSVWDSGPGIAPDILPRVFDPFFTTKEVGKGTGLGLSISYGIIKQHGGDIVVDSIPGKGTTFIIRLPLAEIPAEHRPSITH